MQLKQSLITFIKRSLPSVFFILIFACTLGFLYIFSTYYQISDVEIKNNSKNYPLAGIPIFKDKIIFFTSEKDIEDAIIKNNAFIKQVEVTKQYPQKVILRIETYEPMAYLKSQEGFFVLGEEGVILSKRSTQDTMKIPVITYYQNMPFAEYQAGQRVATKDIRDSIFFLKTLQRLHIPIISIDIDGFHMLGLYSDKQKYIFTAEKDREAQVYNLEQAIHRFKVDGKEYKSIDVRFDKPVIGL